MNALSLKKGASRKSAYDLKSPLGDLIETHTLTVIVDNEAGVLARVIGLFSGRGYNIDSLTVAETDHEGHLSRVTIVTTGTPAVIEQIKAQLDRMVPIHSVNDLTVEGPSVERELGMLKVTGTGEKRVKPCVWPIFFAPAWSIRHWKASFSRSPERPKKLMHSLNLCVPWALPTWHVQALRPWRAALKKTGGENTPQFRNSGLSLVPLATACGLNAGGTPNRLAYLLLLFNYSRMSHRRCYTSYMCRCEPR